jgi:hypothetical protein
MIPQQSGLMVHRARHLFVRQLTALIDAIRAHVACRRRQSRTAENVITQAVPWIRNAA